MLRLLEDMHVVVAQWTRHGRLFFERRTTPTTTTAISLVVVVAVIWIVALSLIFESIYIMDGQRHDSRQTKATIIDGFTI